MIDYTDPDVLTVAKVKCLRSMEFHTRYFFKKQFNRNFIIGAHHSVIFEALERVLEGKLKRLIINIAPRYGKTEIGVKSFMSKGLALNPAAKFIHLSYSDDLALENSEYVRDLVQTKDYTDLFPKVRIKKDSTAKNQWKTTEGGGVLARAAAGQVTGFGAGVVDEEEEMQQDKLLQDEIESIDTVLDQVLMSPLERKFNFAGAIIIDDPIKPEDADQDTIRVKVNSRFDSTIRNRVNSRNTPIIIIMQRLHPEDLCGYLMRDDEQDEWEVISLPCINEKDFEWRDRQGSVRVAMKGEALWPFKHTI